SAIEDVVASVRPFRTITNLRSPLAQANRDQISSDGHSVLVEWDMRGDSTVAGKNIDALLTTTARVARAHPAFSIGEAGSISSGKALDGFFNKQLKQAGERSVPLTLLVLVAVF